MPRITVDGVEYAPTAATPDIAVAITTRNRPDVLAATLQAFQAHSPHIPVIVVDDGSDNPVPGAIRLGGVGVARAKNRCLTELMKLGVQHLFLFDDDTRPACPDWWRPYVESPEPHLQHSWPRFANGKPVTLMDTVYRDDQLVAYGWSMGCMLYLTRQVVDRVGGMNPRFVSMHEHIEYSRRIHQAGLTTFTHQDIPNSEQLFWAGDRVQQVKSTITNRGDLLARNNAVLAELDGNTDFVPYSERDIVLTCLFTGKPDPQRGRPMRPDPKLAATLLDSVTSETVVLCDFPCDDPRFVQVPTSTNPYIQRWISYRRYLIANPDIRFVWCVDATDVEQLKDPFPDMQPGVLYCGWENQIVGCDWMIQNHPDSRAWIEANPNRALLNAGVVGADRNTMLRFTGILLRYWAGKAGDTGDMAVFNRAAYDIQRVETGPRITTLFKANTRNDFSLWRHK